MGSFIQVFNQDLPAGPFKYQKSLHSCWPEMVRTGSCMECSEIQKGRNPINPINPRPLKV